MFRLLYTASERVAKRAGFRVDCWLCSLLATPLRFEPKPKPRKVWSAFGTKTKILLTASGTFDTHLWATTCAAKAQHSQLKEHQPARPGAHQPKLQ
jgi:hypothetical protein